jgi:hypothetical protein
VTRFYFNNFYTIRDSIAADGVSVYDPPARLDDPHFFTPLEMVAILRDTLIGNTDLHGLPLRTRSKLAKELVCRALGYDPPPSFRRISPRLSHPNADVYVQQSNNLQIWNSDVDGARRYVILVLRDGEIRDVHVVPGADLALMDQTGTLTTKYQASRIDDSAGSRLVSGRDTPAFEKAFLPVRQLPPGVSADNWPEPGTVLTIQSAFDRLLPLVGRQYDEPGMTRERNRGEVLHREVCAALGLAKYADTGAFPDVLSQLLEVKLQLASTVDLGLELPSSNVPLASVDGLASPRDVRYAVFYGKRREGAFSIDSLVMSAGQDFFSEFRQFGGNVKNSKLQLRLPPEWFL